MIDIPLQILPGYKTLAIMSEEDCKALKAYKPNQILRAKLTGAEKPRSYQQLKLYWACCKIVADNLKNMTKDDVDFEAKIKIAKEHPSMIKRFRMIDGTVYMEPISISFVNMKHLEACNYFDLAFPFMAEMIDVTVDVLLNNVQF